VRRVCGVCLATVIAAQVLSASAAPLDATPHGLQDMAPRTLSSGLSADESLMFDLPPADAPAFGSPGWMPQAAAAAPNDAPTNAGHETAPTPSGSVIKLAAPPAGLLLMLQGIFCVAFFRGRRKWAALLVTAVAAARGGLTALPRVFISHESEDARQPVAADSEQCSPRAALARGAARPELEYVGLLRRLGADPASASEGKARPEFVKPSPVVVAASPAAGFSLLWPADLHSALVVPRPLDEGAAVPGEKECHPGARLLFCLLARAPPTLA